MIMRLFSLLKNKLCVDNVCILVYNVCMNSTQYTIRSIPPKVDQALRKRSQKTGKSLNEVAVEALTKGAGLVDGSTFNDLDWFVGSMLVDPRFDEAIDWLNSLPQDI